MPIAIDAKTGLEVRYIRNELQALVAEWRRDGIDLIEIYDALRDAAEELAEQKGDASH